MKLALFTTTFLPGLDGVSVMVLRRVERLSRWGHHVLILAPSYAPAAAVYPDWRHWTGNIFPNVRVVGIPSRRSIGGRFERGSTPWGYRTALQELRRFAPNVVHSDETERDTIGYLRRPGLAFARAEGLPCLACFHTNFLEYAEDYLPQRGLAMDASKWLWKHSFLPWVYNGYDATLVGSTVTHGKLVSFGIRNTRLCEISGIELDRFDAPGTVNPNFFSSKYDLQGVDDRVKVVVLGRLTPDKGWAFMMKEMEGAPRGLLDRIALIIAGDGDMYNEIRNRLTKVTPHAHLLHHIPSQDVPALLRNCDIYLTTSEKENRSIAKLEAMAARLPVLAPRCGWTTEDLQENGNALLFAPSEPGDMIRKLTVLTDDATLRRRLGDSARLVVARFDWDVTVRNWLDVVEEYVRRHR